MKRLIFDTANILFRVSAAHGKNMQSGTPEEQAGLALHVALNTCLKYYRKYKPDQIAVTFEGTKNWRKEYTKSDECISKKVYKANRIRDSSMQPFFELIASFEELVRKHTSLVCLSNPILEGDDVFSGYVQRFAEMGDEVIGISGDKDFVSLLKYKNFTLINPDKGKPRTLTEVCGHDDADFFMFEKAFRGDKGDNVFPAFPNVRKTRLLKCYTDEYEKTKIMNETWSFIDPTTKEEIVYRVGDLFNENNLLTNLYGQPDYVKKVIQETLDYELVNHGKYSHFHFVKFCGKHGLKQIADNAQHFAEMFNITGKKSPLKNETIEARRKNILMY